MKFAFLSLFIASILGIIILYLLNTTYPLNFDKIQNDVEMMKIQSSNADTILNYLTNDLLSENSIIMYLSNDFWNILVILCLFLFFFSAFIFIAIDKIFFKKVHERPSIEASLRRSIYIVVIFIGFIFTRFYGFDIDFLLALIGIILLTEMLLLNIRKIRK